MEDKNTAEYRKFISKIESAWINSIRLVNGEIVEESPSELIQLLSEKFNLDRRLNGVTQDSYESIEQYMRNKLNLMERYCPEMPDRTKLYWVLKGVKPEILNSVFKKLKIEEEEVVTIE